MADGTTVADKIADIAASKAAIAEAIAGKGVAVPAGTKLAGMAGLIGAIQAGGGSPFDKLFEGLAIDREMTCAPCRNESVDYNQKTVVLRGANSFTLLHPLGVPTDGRVVVFSDGAEFHDVSFFQLELDEEGHLIAGISGLPLDETHPPSGLLFVVPFAETLTPKVLYLGLVAF